MARAKGLKRHRTSRTAKVEWLKARPEMQTLPPLAVAGAMILAGLYSKNTRWQDINARRLLREARG